MLSNCIVTLAPASTACCHNLSTFFAYTWRVTGLVPRESGACALPPGNTSDIIKIESPILILACIRFPSGTGCRASSFAPKAFLYQSIAAAAPLIARYGVMVRNPGGIGAFLDLAGFFAFPFFDLDLGMIGARETVD